MKIITFLLALLSICTVLHADSAAPVCHKCEIIREYNASHPENNYYWYDDYLKDKNEGKAHESQQKTLSHEMSDKAKKDS